MGRNSPDFTNDPLDDQSSGHITSTSDFVMPVGEVVQKRPYQGYTYGEPPAKRPAPSITVGAGFKWNLQALSNAADAVESGGKSPVSALNELGVQVRYSVLRQCGPAHCPSFTVNVSVCDLTYTGWGNSKREARASAARACLGALLAKAGRVLRQSPPGVRDFSEDELVPQLGPEIQCVEAKVKPVNAKKVSSTPTTPTNAPGAPPPQTTSAPTLFGVSLPPTVGKSPINLLYENYPGLNFVATYGDGTALHAPNAPAQLSHNMRFKVSCQIKDQTFEGYGSSKKLAKLAAARAACASLDEARCLPVVDAATAALPQTVADLVAKLVNEKFTDLMRDDPVHAKRKVLAGIVITINNRPEGAKVIAVTTGTKVVKGDNLSDLGYALNDSHAEIIARRCLQAHLYRHLHMYAEAGEPRCAIPASDVEPVAGGGFRLKADRQVHLYVSTAPCGDGRIFSPHEHIVHQPDRHPNRMARGQLRTKIESGEGTIPVKNSDNTIQTWDGVMQGERLLTMSCSDKVARWCVVGLQGALLSRLMQPVYLHSIVLGSLMHREHMYRAIRGRYEAHLSLLPPPFRLQSVKIARAASLEQRQPARTPPFSVVWSHAHQEAEVINATTGKMESGQPSILCKQSMFARWLYLMKRLPPLPQEDFAAPKADLAADLDSIPYNEAKQLSPAYQLAKERLIEAFDKAKLGRWVKKPIEQDMFYCQLKNADPKLLFT